MMERRSEVLVICVVITILGQACSLNIAQDYRASGLYKWGPGNKALPEIMRRQEYSKNPVNWEQLWKLKTLLDQVGKRK